MDVAALPVSRIVASRQRCSLIRSCFLVSASDALRWWREEDVTDGKGLHGRSLLCHRKLFMVFPLPHVREKANKNRISLEGWRRDRVS